MKALALIVGLLVLGTAAEARVEVAMDNVAGAQLVFVSNRDGDDEVYAVDAANRRVAALTRNRAYDSVAATPRGRWLAVVRDFDRLFLLGRDGRRQRLVARGVVGPGGDGPPVFSRDGRRLAFTQGGEGTSGSVALNTRVLSIATGRMQRFVGVRAVAFSPNGRLLAIRDDRTRAIGVIDLARSRRWIVPGNGFVGWSPDSKRIAFTRTTESDDPQSTLFVAEMQKGRPAPTTLVRGKILEAHWLNRGRLGFYNKVPGAGDSQIGVVGAIDGKSRVLVRGLSDYTAVWWSPRGDRVAYSTGDVGVRELHLAALAGGPAPTVFRAQQISAEWSPTGRRLAFAGSVPGRGAELRISDLRGKAQLVARRDRLYVVGWSLNERWLAVELERGMGIVTVASRKLHLVWPTFVREEIWLGDALSKKAPTAPRARPDTATARQLRSRGRVLEIASDATRLAALLDRSRVDCSHVVGWVGGKPRVVRFNTPSPCDDANPDEHMKFRLGMSGTQISWHGRFCGNECYALACSADFGRPYRQNCGETGSVPRGMPPPRPRPPRETHRGVSLDARRGGAITLRRSSDGRTKTIQPAGGVVDAELEDDGLFYAYNTRGSFPGRVIFVPFAELFR